MSQQKVDQKKHDKANRKSIVRKKKIEEIASLVCVSIIAIAIVGWIGFSVYKKAEQVKLANATYEYNEITTTAIQDYLNTLNQSVCGVQLSSVVLDFTIYTQFYCYNDVIMSLRKANHIIIYTFQGGICNV